MHHVKNRGNLKLNPYMFVCSLGEVLLVCDFLA
jgi:hypothetical protein